jgi:hypothetical protein
MVTKNCTLRLCGLALAHQQSPFVKGRREASSHLVLPRGGKQTFDNPTHHLLSARHTQGGANGLRPNKEATLSQMATRSMEFIQKETLGKI